MAMLALSYYTWIQGMNLRSCRLRVSYRNFHGSKNNYYDLREIDHSGKTLSASIVRSGGGLACTMTARLDSSDRVEMTHGTQHVAGLTEIFTLRKDEIVGGHHRNSLMYRSFAGRVKADGTKIELVCEIKDKSGREFLKFPYELSIDSKQLSS